MDASFSFREAQPRDADRIAFLQGNPWRTVWRERLANPQPNQFVMLAEHDDDLAGFVCAFGDEDVLWGSLIEHLHVAPAYSRRGLGTQLVAYAAEWLCTNYPDSRVYLWTLEASESARRFFEQLGGFNVGTRHRLDIDGGSGMSCRYVWQRPQALQLPGSPPLCRSQPCLTATRQARLDPHDVS